MNPAAHLQIETINLLPGQEWVDQSDAWRFARVSSGAAYWLDPARPRALGEGELAIIAPRSRAVVRASQIGEVVLQRFVFAPGLLCGFFSLAERDCLERGAGREGPVQFLPSTHGLSQRYAAAANRTERMPDIERRAEVLGLVAAFVGEAMSRNQPARRGATQGRFDELISRMPDVELIGYTAQQMARLCGCSPRQFNRLFRERFGEAPRTRQTGLRLIKACQILTQTDGPIAQVALESGFRSPSLFNALFKKRFGVSPSEWRHRNRNAVLPSSDLPDGVQSSGSERTAAHSHAEQELCAPPSPVTGS